MLPAGSVIAISDFTDIASPKTVSKMLTRLAEDGQIEKVMRSVFWKPDGKHLDPAPNDVANALARENNWFLAPSGDTALHIMGLEEDVPAVWTYVTNGTYRNYKYGTTEISFTHTNWTFFNDMSEKTKLLVQCMKAYGKEHLSEEKIMALFKKCQNWEWRKVVEETKNATNWVTKMVLKLCGFQTAEVKSNRGK